MNIYFSPVSTEQTLEAEVSGDVLTLNGEVYDFTPLDEGDHLPPEAVGSDWISGVVSRVDGKISLTLIAPYTGQGSHAQRFPEPALNVDGPVPFPAPWDIDA